jgi:hypothetical protein
MEKILRKVPLRYTNFCHFICNNIIGHSEDSGSSPHIPTKDERHLTIHPNSAFLEGSTSKNIGPHTNPLNKSCAFNQSDFPFSERSIDDSPQQGSYFFCQCLGTMRFNIPFSQAYWIAFVPSDISF